MDLDRADILLQALDLAAARNRNEPRLLHEQPGERDLRRSCLFLRSDASEQVDHDLIGFDSLQREARAAAANIRAVEGGGFVDLARQIAPTERAVGHEANAKLLTGRQHVLFRGSPPQRVFTLDGRNRLDGVSAPDDLRRGFRQSEMLHLACFDELLHRSGHVLDRDVRIDSVLIKQIDGVYLEALQRFLGDLFDARRMAIETCPSGTSIGVELETKLCSDHHPSPKGKECFPHQLFVGKWSIDLGCVEEGDATVHRCMKKSNHLCLVSNRLIRKGHAHAAEPDGGDFQAAVSKSTFLHSSYLLSCSSSLA